MVTHHGTWGHSPLLLMSLIDERCVLPEPMGWLCLQLDFPPSVAELFRLPPLKTHRLSSHAAVLQASLENVFTTTILLSIALWWTFSGFGYLGHSKKSLIDWLMHHSVVSWYQVTHILCATKFVMPISVLETWSCDITQFMYKKMWALPLDQFPLACC